LFYLGHREGPGSCHRVNKSMWGRSSANDAKDPGKKINENEMEEGNWRERGIQKKGVWGGKGKTLPEKKADRKTAGKLMVSHRRNMTGGEGVEGEKKRLGNQMTKTGGGSGEGKRGISGRGSPRKIKRAT